MLQSNDNIGWWENWVDSPEEEEYFNDKILEQKDCCCSGIYVCDKCAYERKITTN